ncbi:MAG: SAM-dependent methyltransferase, partial [Candidatus Thermoplasmatota archaeon]|nr:SAM-dependent methyltransferase [Candidatus Thermoplasmatota archaeon]
DLIGTIALGDKDSRSKDVLGRVYEYFLGQFANAEGKKGGQFYTPRCIVQLLVQMIKPYEGRVFDPCCGSGGMFVSSEKFIEAHGGNVDDISIYGQESNPTTWKLCKMNLAIRNIPSDNIKWNTEGSFQKDLHTDLKAKYVLANPPFNDSDWGGDRLKDDVRWKYGTPPPGNANFAWVQHFIHHLAPYGFAGFVLANGSMSSGQSGEGEIRKQIVEKDLVDCMVALPGQLFYNTQIPACLWFIARNRDNTGLKDRRGKILFIDARKMGTLTDRTHKELTVKDIKKIADTYHAWRGDSDEDSEVKEYEDIPGFCKAASIEEVRKHGHVLTPGRYVGAEAVEDDGVPFDEKMTVLTKQLSEQMAEGEKLDKEIKKNLNVLGYEV